MNKYEISLWEDFQSTNGIDERKIGTIGTDKMTTWTRAREPKMVENINGTHTFSFKMFYTYIDEITGETVLNPFRPYLINERKVKVFWQDEWYDLIIKSIDEDSSGNSAVYTCKDLFITELSKNGYNIELTSDLQNNSGTASDLTEQVLKGSGWRFNSEQSDKIYQYLEQPVYESVVSGSASLSVSLVSPTGESGNITIPLSATILVLKSSLDGIKESTTESREVHVIYADDLRTEYNEMLVINGQEYKFTGNVTRNSNNTFTIVAGNSRINSLQLSTRYRAKGLVQSQKTVYDPLFERYVNIYSDNQGSKIYGFQTTEFSDPIAVVNLIVNPSNFKNTSGWIGQNIEWMIYPDNWDNVDMSTYNATGYLKIPTGSVYNNGISANLNLLQPTTSELKNGDIGGFHVGDKFIFRAKVKNSLSSNSYVKTGFNFQICEFNNDYTIKGNSYFSSSTINPSSEWYEAVLTCTQSCPATELEKLGFFFTNSSNSVLYIEEVQFFKEVQGTDDVINYYTISQPQLTINIFEANGKTYSFYKESEAKTLIYLKDIPDGYTIEPSDGNGSQYWPLDKTIRSKANQSGSTVYNVINQSDNIISTFTVEINNETYNSNYIETVKTYVAPGEIYLQGVASVVYKYYNADQTGVLLPEEVDFLYVGEEESPNFTPVYTYEKITTVEAKGSNRFNILQSIAENFQCWVRFTINHDSNGKITLDSNGLPEKYITLVNDLGVDLGWSFIYGIDLNAIKRKIISEDIVTKTIVLDNNNEFGKNGFCSIARSPLNYARENFILNFDYYINAGLLDQDEVNADLYSTSDNHLGYLYKLNDWNNQYIESIEVLVQKKLELDKQSSELEVLKGRNKATLEEITKKESDIIKLAGTSTFSEAQQYVIDNPDNQKVQSLMATIGQLRKDQTALASKIDNLEDSVENLRDYVDKQDAAQRAIVSTIKNLHDEFFKKYSRYIQEGVWQSEDYISDDKYYLDATEIAHTSAYPKVQYEISVIRLNALEEFSSKKFNVGDVCYIQDKDFFNFVTEDGNPYKLQIVISEITSYFDNPEKDVIKVQNYKTQFEDLFQRITATTQSLQYSQGSYARAADAFNSNGALKFDLLQQTFDNNANIVMNASNQDVIWDSTGITIKDSTNSAQLLRIMSGGLFVSNDGGLTWKNAVRGDGISTDVLTAGRINTGEIFILNDDYPTFRWDSNGITAYSWDNNGVNFNKFVRYDQYGLYGYEGLADFIPDDIDDITSNATFGLTWDGFFMKSSSGNGEVIINSNDSEGKVIKSTKNGQETFWLKNTGDASFRGTVYATSLVLGDNVTIPAGSIEGDISYDIDEQDIIDILQENGYVTEQDLGDYLTEDDLNGYVTESDLNGYATEQYVNNQGYATQSYVTSQGYATQQYVNNSFNGYETAAVAGGKYVNLNVSYGNNSTDGFLLKADGSAFLKGAIVANYGFIGGWNINPNISQASITINGQTYTKKTDYPNGSLYYGTSSSIGTNGTIALIPTGNTTSKAIAGSEAKRDWRLIVGSNFAVDSNGNVYATNGHFSGSITATSITLGTNVKIPASKIDGDIPYDLDEDEILEVVSAAGYLQNDSSDPYITNSVLESKDYATEGYVTGQGYVNQTAVNNSISNAFQGYETASTAGGKYVNLGVKYGTGTSATSDNFILKADGNAFLSGAIVAKSGFIGGWNINPETNVTITDKNNNTVKTYTKDTGYPNGALYYGASNSIGNAGTIALIPNGTTASTQIAGSDAKSDWRLIVGANFGVDNSGNVYANNGHFKGTISADTLVLSNGAKDYIGNVISNKGYITSSQIAQTYMTKSEINGYIKVNQSYGDTVFSYDVSTDNLLTANNIVVNGTVYATDGSFAGEVKASSGNIGGWQVATGAKETYAAKTIPDNTIIGSDTMKPNQTYTYIIKSTSSSYANNPWWYYRKNGTSAWTQLPSGSPSGTFTVDNTQISYNFYKITNNNILYSAIDLKYNNYINDTKIDLSFPGNVTNKIGIKIQRNSDSNDIENGIPATKDFSIDNKYWNRFVPDGALFRPDYSNSSFSGLSGELFEWYPDNILPSGTASDSTHKFELVPWKGIYLSPVDNDKAYIKIPGSTETDGSNLKDDWRLLIGSNFGIDSTGALYASSGKMGNFSIASDRIYYEGDGSSSLGAAGANRFCIIPAGGESIRTVNGIAPTSGAWKMLIGNNFGIDSSGNLYMNGGTINAGQVTFSAYQNTTQGGGFKCATGNDGLNTTYGAMVYGGTTDTNYFIATNSGVRMTSGTGNSLVSLYCSGGVIKASESIDQTSDRREKHNITYNLEEYEPLFELLKPTTYEYNNGASNRKHIGFISQDFEDALNSLNISTQDFAALVKEKIYDDDNNIIDYRYGIRYSELIGLNTHMIQKLMKQIEDLQQEIENLKQ